MNDMKYRAWHTSLERWVYFTLEDAFYGWVFSEDRSDKWKITDASVLVNESMHIGLKDRNGIAIFGGDVIKISRDKAGYGYTSYGGFAEVTAKTCGYSLRCFSPSFDELEKYPLDEDGDVMTWDSTSLWHITDDEGKNIEVIGNVRENPELLKEAA